MANVHDAKDTSALRVVEFYAGIGGLHSAFSRSSFGGTVVRAYDWDQAACRVYEANHGQGIIRQADISCLNSSELGDLDADVWLLSPSCQPYTVLNPLAKGAADPRAKSFIHLIEQVLPDLVEMNKQPKYLLVENVAGFETSSTRQRVLHVMKQLQYSTSELLLTPLQFGIPNSRLRYYLLAKAKPMQFTVGDTKGQDAREGGVLRHIPGDQTDWVDPRTSDAATDDHVDSTTQLREYIDLGAPFDEFRIPDRVLEKWGRLFDIVTPSSRRTCCFTRGYTKLVERAGSILQLNEELDTTTVFDQFLAAQDAGDTNAVRILDPLKLRYFSPEELLRIFNLVPPDGRPFVWPPNLSNKTKYKLIGNSVNVAVVSKLIDYLLK